MSPDNLGYFFAGVTVGYMLRVVGVVITVLEIGVYRLIKYKPDGNTTTH